VVDAKYGQRLLASPIAHKNSIVALEKSGDRKTHG